MMGSWGWPGHLLVLVGAAPTFSRYEEYLVKSVLRVLFVFVVIFTTFAPAQAAIEVTFIKPGDYSDSAVRGGPFGSGSFGVVNAIREHLMELGNQNLTLKEGLRIEVLDIDLAGRYEWWRFPFDKRVMRESSSPVIEVRYFYYVSGKKVDEGEERITDVNYLKNTGKGEDGEILKYEKRMLDRWFRDRFVNHKSAKN